MPTEDIQIADSLVAELRTRFLAENNLDFEKKDINDITNEDLILRPFLQEKRGNVDEALKMLTTAMKWRKTYGVNQLTEESFPLEYFQIGALFPYGQDINGAQMIIFRVKINKKIGEWTELLKKFIVYYIEKEYIRFRNNQNKGVCIVFDCNGAGITNVDIDLISFIVKTLSDNYPKLLRAVLINELPWILNYVLKLVQSWLPKDQQELLCLTKLKELDKYATTEELPDFMNGTNQLPYRTCPKNAPSAQEIAQRSGIKTKDLEKLLTHLEPHLKSV